MASGASSTVAYDEPSATLYLFQHVHGEERFGNYSSQDCLSLRPGVDPSTINVRANSPRSKTQHKAEKCLLGSWNNYLELTGNL